LQEKESASNIYLNRSLSDLYLFKGLHGYCAESLLKSEHYLKQILNICLIGYDEIENGSLTKRGEINEKMVTEGRCGKNQEIIYDCLYNIVLININMARRNSEKTSYLEKARNLAKFGILNFENCSPFWMLYAFTEDSSKKKKAALLASISVDPQVSSIKFLLLTIF